MALSPTEFRYFHSTLQMLQSIIYAEKVNPIFTERPLCGFFTASSVSFSSLSVLPVTHGKSRGIIHSPKSLKRRILGKILLKGGTVWDLEGDQEGKLLSPCDGCWLTWGLHQLWGSLMWFIHLDAAGGFGCCFVKFLWHPDLRKASKDLSWPSFPSSSEHSANH